MMFARLANFANASNRYSYRAEVLLLTKNSSPTISKSNRPFEPSLENKSSETCPGTKNFYFLVISEASYFAALQFSSHFSFISPRFKKQREK